MNPRSPSVVSGPRHPVIRVIDCHVCRPLGTRFEFLVLRRASKKIYADSFRMVGGKLEEGETAWQACVRELAEETQLTVVRLITVPYVNRFYEWQEDRINDIPVFVAVVEPGAEPRLDDEHVEARWVSSGEACELLPWPAQREGLLAAERMLLDGGPLMRFLEVDLQDAGATSRRGE